MDSMLSIGEIAEMYGISTKTVRRWAARGDIQLERLPGGRLLRADAATLQGITEPVNFKGRKSKVNNKPTHSKTNFGFMSAFSGDWK